MFCTFLLITPHTTQAQSSFSGVYPFSPGAGTLGFFDQNTGTVYVYTSDLSRLIREIQVEQLGKVIKKDVTDKRETYGVR